MFTFNNPPEGLSLQAVLLSAMSVDDYAIYFYR